MAGPRGRNPSQQPGGAGAGNGRGAGGRTRDRILDVALDLFLEQGYERTSLREIAERMGFTKAALYYHFASKSDLLMALHLRLHRATEQSLEELGDRPSAAAWSRFLDGLIGQLSANGKLMMLHVRDEAALRAVHNEGHDEQHAELEQKMRSLVTDASIPFAQRVRMVTALAIVFMVPMVFTQAAGELDAAELGPALRAIVRDVLEVD